MGRRAPVGATGHAHGREAPRPCGGARARRLQRAREAFFAGARVPPELVGFLAPSDALRRVLAAETGGGQEPMGVTSLETFALCPFRGYAARVLGARERRVVGDVPDALDEGSTLHGALAAAFRATALLWRQRPRDGEAVLGAGLAAADAYFARESLASGPRRMALDLARRDVLRVLAWSLADEVWDFAEAEKAFGDGADDSWPVLTLDDGYERVALKGRIDRVDVAHRGGGVRALDYKLREPSALRQTRQLGEIAFQLPLYAAAAASATGGGSTAGMYLPARARSLLPGYVTRGTEDAWARAHARDGDQPHYIARAITILAEVRSGMVPPSPRDAGACETCGFAGGCRKPRFASALDSDEGA
jgi:RecB family exonuclease